MTDALVILKPDGAHRVAVRAAIWSWLSSEREWELKGLTWYRPPTDLVEIHYDFLRDRPFFPWLIDFMSALPVLVGRVTARPDALELMRYELGETRINESRPGSLRELYGIGGGVNILHLSDSPESGARETELWSSRVSLDALDADLDDAHDRPDHTFHLRSLAAQYGAGIHTELAAQTIKGLLTEESDLAGQDLDALARVVLRAFRS
ncbi:MAG TPA: nucleoside-diphosphate kinase [Candidatus Dormibacteraeota bacterium]|nr:nucleoside-diphosphate kinase [Candidatus Dormibacteraeota bacterium]